MAFYYKEIWTDILETVIKLKEDEAGLHAVTYPSLQAGVDVKAYLKKRFGSYYWASSQRFFKVSPIVKVVRPYGPDGIMLLGLCLPCWVYSTCVSRPRRTKWWS